MRKATGIVAAALGFVAGMAGLEHGYFEIQQGAVRPPSMMFFPSVGAPCDPGNIWNACEPAMTVLPSLLATGILALLLGLAIMIWSAAFIRRTHGGAVLIILSVLLLLFGGGFFPPLIGLVGGAAGTRINKPLEGNRGRLIRFSAHLWPWPLAALLAWLLVMFPLGYFFNDFLKSIMGFGLLLIPIMLALSVYSGYARDAAA